MSISAVSSGFVSNTRRGVVGHTGNAIRTVGQSLALGASIVTEVVGRGCDRYNDHENSRRVDHIKAFTRNDPNYISKFNKYFSILHTSQYYKYLKKTRKFGPQNLNSGIPQDKQSRIAKQNAKDLCEAIQNNKLKGLEYDEVNITHNAKIILEYFEPILKKKLNVKD